jgi:hypothetical protein
VYTVKILSAGGPSIVNNLIYDFSGSSYHYNSDYGTGGLSVTATNPVSAPIGSKTFNPSSGIVGSIVNASIAIKNTAATPISGVNFVDTFPAGVTLGATSETGSCLVAGTLTVAGNTFSLANASIAAGATCNYNVAVTANVAGLQTNPTFVVHSNEATDAIVPLATLQIASSPSAIKSISPNPLAKSATLNVVTVAVNNPNNFDMTGVNFIDVLPPAAVLTGSVTSFFVLPTTCSGTMSGTTSFQLAAGIVPAMTTCSFSAYFTTTTTNGAYVNPSFLVGAANSPSVTAASVPFSITDAGFTGYKVILCLRMPSFYLFIVIFPKELWRTQCNDKDPTCTWRINSFAHCIVW